MGRPLIRDALLRIFDVFHQHWDDTAATVLSCVYLWVGVWLRAAQTAGANSRGGATKCSAEINLKVNSWYKARDLNLNPIGRQFRLYSPARPQPALFRSESLKLIWIDEWIWAACARAQSSKGGAAQRSATATTASIVIPEDVSDIGFFVLRFLSLIRTVKCTKAPILQILVNFAGLS